MKKSRLEQFMPLCLHHGRYWNESFEGKRMLNTSKKKEFFCRKRIEGIKTFVKQVKTKKIPQNQENGRN